jgi:hypothetical protein
MFNVGNHTWEPRAEDEERHVPLLGIAGRIGIVARASSQPGAALELLSWLSSGRGGDSVAAASLATTLYRRTQLKSPKAWVEPPITPSAASQYAVLTEQTFRRRQWLVALRIPGREGYLSALDEAVRQAVQSQRSPRESLRQAAQQWSAITDRLGRQRQRLAYLQSLGIPP